MKNWACVSGSATGIRSQSGQTVYTFLGLIIIGIVVVAAFLLPWNEMSTPAQDPELMAANKALDNKDFKAAVAGFSKCLQANPNNGAALVGRSKAYVQLGSLDKALDDATAAVEKKPNLANAYGQRGIILKLQRKYEEALQDFNKAVKLDPRYAWAYAQRADIYSRQGDHEKALINVNKALAGKPNFAEGLRVRGWILTSQGKCKEAFEDFKKVEKLGPNDAWSIQDKAWFLMTCPDETLQDASKALELAEKAAKMPEGKDGLIYETLAEAYFKKGDALKAAEFQKKAIEMGSKKCPDGACTKEMKERLQKYELVARREIRSSYEILPLDSGVQ